MLHSVWLAYFGAIYHLVGDGAWRGSWDECWRAIGEALRDPALHRVAGAELRWALPIMAGSWFMIGLRRAWRERRDGADPARRPWAI